MTNLRLDNDHEFNWCETRILDRELSYTKRLVSEMVFIKRQKNELPNELVLSDMKNRGEIESFSKKGKKEKKNVSKICKSFPN